MTRLIGLDDYLQRLPEEQEPYTTVCIDCGERFEDEVDEWADEDGLWRKPVHECCPECEERRHNAELDAEEAAQ